LSRPNITDLTVDGLAFARACVLDQRNASHASKNYSWDERYRAALEALDMILNSHKKAAKKAGKKARSA